MLYAKQLTVCLAIAGYISHASAGMPFVRSRKTPTPAITINPPQVPQRSIMETLASVEQTIKNVENMPSCNQIAAKHLLHSCETFQDRRDGTSADKHLEAYQQLFAIRTTGCEMAHAHHDMPYICQPLLDPDLRGMPTDQNIQNCLHALASQGTNHWTTYNRIKSDGLIMCHGLRAQADKDDQIHLARILFSTTADINAALNMQKDEFESVTSLISGVGRSLVGFRDAMHRDNQEIKGSLKVFSEELKGSMTDINENAQELLQTVSNAKELVVQHSVQVSSALELATARSGETEVEWAARLETLRQNLDLFQERYDYSIQQMMDTVHAGAFSMSQSVNEANDWTSDLAGKLAELTTGLDLPLGKVNDLNAGLDEMATKQNLTTEAINKTHEAAQATQELIGGVTVYVKTLHGFFHGALSVFGSFSIYFTIIFLAVFVCMWRYVSHFWAPGVAVGIALYLSATFVWIHSPIEFAKTVLDHHPVFFMSPYWSMLIVGSFAIALYKAIEAVYGRICGFPDAGYEFQLPRDEKDAVI